MAAECSHDINSIGRAAFAEAGVFHGSSNRTERVGKMPAYRHLIETSRLERTWIESELFPLCDELGSGQGSGRLLDGRSLYCLFYEPSFLTRTSFERACGLLGGAAYHTEDASQFYPVSTPRHIDNIIGMLASLHMDVVVLRSSEVGVVQRAAEADAVPIINGGSLDDHPTQALADLRTLSRELGGIDGLNIAVVGRLEHRNVSALLRAIALYRDVRVTLLPFSGQADPDVVSYCESKGVHLATADDIEAVRAADAVYLNGPRTLAHARLVRSRGGFDLRIDRKFMSMLKSHCIVLDPMQRSGDFEVEVNDARLAFYRQAENALLVRMALLAHMLRA